MHLLTCLYFSFTYVHTSLESLLLTSPCLGGSGGGSRQVALRGWRASIREKVLDVAQKIKWLQGT